MSMYDICKLLIKLINCRIVEMIHFISMTPTKMENRDFNNCEIASIVSFAIAFNGEEARKLFLKQFGKE